MATVSWLKLRHPSKMPRELGHITARAPLTAAAVSPDGALLVAGTQRGGLSTWRLPSGEPTTTLRGHTRPITALRFLSPDSLLAADGEGRVVLWELSQGLPLSVTHDHRGAIHGLAVSGRLRLTCGDDRRVVLRDLHSGEVGELGGLPARGTALAAAGDRLAVGGADGSVVLWGEDGEPRLLGAHEGPVTACAFAPDGALLTASADHTIRRWADDTWSTHTRHEGPVRSLYIQGDELISAGDDQQIAVWSLPELTPLGALRGHRRPIVAVAATEALIVSASSDRTARWWARSALPPPGWRPIRHSGSVRACVVSGDVLVTAGRDATVQRWSVDSGAHLGRLDGPEQAVMDLAISPSGQRIAAVSVDGAVWLWEEGGAGRTLRTAGVALCCCEWQGEGTLLVGDVEGTIHTFDIDRAASRSFESGHQGRARGLAVHPDGRRFASAGYDGTVRLWEGARCVRVLSVSARPVIRCAFSPDGALLVTGSLDGTVQCWDADGQARRWVGEGHSDGVSGLAFQPDGALVSASKDGTLRRWDLGTGAVLATHRCPEPLDSLAARPGGLVVGDVAGDIWILDA